MKSLPILALLGGALLLFSCSKDNDVKEVNLPDTGNGDSTGTVYPRGNYATFYRTDTVGEPAYVDYFDYMEDGKTIRRIKSVSPATDSTMYTFTYNADKRITNMAVTTGPNTSYGGRDYNFHYNNAGLLDSIWQVYNSLGTTYSFYWVATYDHNNRIATFSGYEILSYNQELRKNSATIFFRDAVTGELDSLRTEEYYLNEGELSERLSVRFDAKKAADSVVKFDPAYLLALWRKIPGDFLNPTTFNPFGLQFLDPGEQTFRQGKANYWYWTGSNYSDKPLTFKYTVGADNKLNYFQYYNMKYLTERTVSVRL